jgi:hypothetical protein
MKAVPEKTRHHVFDVVERLKSGTGLWQRESDRESAASDALRQ